MQILDNFSRAAAVLRTVAVDPDGIIDSPRFDPPRADRFPDWSQAEQAPIDHEFILDAEPGGPYGVAWTIDGRTWPKSEPYEVQSGRFYHLRFTNRSARLHPMHLHGQFFRLIARGGQAVNESFWRDTVLVGPEESLDVALVPVDAGIWAQHCHILDHAEAGMMTALRVK